MKAVCKNQHEGGRICLRLAGHKGHHEDAEGVHWQSPKPRDKVVYAELHTRHFDFDVIAATGPEATRALREAWQRHRAQYADGGVDVAPWSYVVKDVSFRTMEIGVAYRDQTPLTK